MSRPASHRPIPARPIRRRLAAGGLALGRLVRAAVALAALIALIVGLPWGLAHFIGWPLPHHVPSWDEIEARLTGPMDDTLLLDILAVLLWPLWAAFTLSVVAAVPDVVREARWPSHRPPLPSSGMRGLATFLLGAVLLTVLQARGPLTPTSGPAAAPAVATAPAAPRFVPAAATSATDPALPAAAAGTAVVQLPANGVYDSLWRIADRCLGDGARWPEIWALNHGVLQADGRALTQPGLIRPGWVLTLPTPPDSAPSPAGNALSSPPLTPPTSQAPTSPAPTTTAPSSVSPPAASPPATPTPPASAPAPGHAAPPAPVSPPTSPATPSPTSAPPTTPAAPPAHPSAPSRPPGVQFPSGGYLGLGAVALLVVALYSVRLWRRRHYVPGSGVRDDLNEAPVIHQLAAAYNTATAERDADGELVVVRPPGDPHITGRCHAAATATAHAAPPGTRVVGTTGDGQPLALDLAATRGLGLIGPGADAAIRALLVTLLVDRHQPDAAPAEILIPAADARRLLGEDTTATPPQRLHIVPDLPTLLDRLEADVITRARRAAAGEDPRRTSLIVLAAPDQTSDRRLQAVLDNGSPLGVVGILYGQWRPGATARVRPDGVIGAASPDIAAALVGNRLFTLPENDTGQLLDLLADADAPAANQEDFRRANPTQGPPPPPPTSAPPPSSSTAAPVPPPPSGRPTPDVSPAADEPPGPDEPLPPGGGAAPTEPTYAVPPTPAAGPLRPPRAATPLLLTLFGRLQLRYRAAPDGDYQPVDGIGGPSREILAYLAAHPDGAERRTIIDAVWPDDGKLPRQRDNRFYAAISQLRRSLAAATGGTIDDVFDHDDRRWRLRRDLFTVDLWQVDEALDARRRATTTTDELAAILPLAATYTGHLADDIAGTWAETHRESLRRQVSDALASITAAVGEENPRRLELLETLRRLDPYSEGLYVQIARAQARLGLHDAVEATYRQLVVALAELGERPTPDADRLFQAARRPGPPGTRSA
ncbi:LysM domain-containing protein [Parafrankia irregularis]|uniref:LysM domain-containing protein n=1 Tax=Parafrankia irregularis TaxID=795642 RepID=A0A0S4R0B4_9ACTN|nr:MULTISPECIES: BTAD domain-containing putative transcriptional regulator [Parafrankia]MBE3200393.1 LysM peptidoglycan-binding domain-containing protein [Parafrankia sp. CH37]CUU61171.1 LysM domain-containing protein [Parafrankia irregularis]